MPLKELSPSSNVASHCAFQATIAASVCRSARRAAQRDTCCCLMPVSASASPQLKRRSAFRSVRLPLFGVTLSPHHPTSPANSSTFWPAAVSGHHRTDIDPRLFVDGATASYRRVVPVPHACAPRSASPGSRPHWHSGPNQPLCGPMTLPQPVQLLRFGGVGGLGIGG